MTAHQQAYTRAFAFESADTADRARAPISPVKAKPGRKPGHHLADRIRSYFEANPTEELTRRDLCAKFDASISHTDYAIRNLCGREFELVHVLRLKAAYRPEET